MIQQLGKKLFTGLFLLLLLVQTFAQEQNFFVVTGRLTTDDGKIDGATITVTKNDAGSETITPPRTGRFRFEFDFNNEYKLTFQKEGFFKKIIVVSSHVPQDVMDRDNRFPPLTFMVNLFQELAGIDKSFTNKPVGRVFYNADIDNFDTEIFFSDIQIEETIEEAIAQNDGLTKEEREIQRARELELAEREKDYDKTVKDADALYQQRKLEEALTKYQYASSLFPNRPYPKDRIAELQDLIAATQLAEQEKQEQQASYQVAIDQGDAAFAGANYELARQHYEAALQVIPNDEYATNQIREAGLKLEQQQLDQQYADIISQADQLYQDKDLQNARAKYVEAAILKPGQADYPQARIQKIDEELLAQEQLAELNRQYDEAMREGDQLFGREEYGEALLAYRRAAGLKEGDELANRKIDETEQIILQLEKQASYDEHIALADEAFNAGDLVKAKSNYQEALVHLPDENYPKTKIAEIDQLVASEEQFNQLMAQAKQAFDSGDLAQAKLLYQQALQIKDEAEIREKIDEVDELLAQQELDDNYRLAIERADASFNNEEYEQAKTDYNEAIALKSNEQYPKDQIQKIDQEIARLADLAERERQYQAAMQQGETAFGLEQYQNALTAYQSALSFKENDPLAQDKIRETESMIEQQETKRNYDEQIAQADQAFQNEQWLNAKSLYGQALALIPDEDYPKRQISQIDQIIATNNQFDELVTQAQQAFSAENYLLSKDYYQQALAIKNEPTLQARIDEIDQILTQQELDNSYNSLIAQADEAYQSQQLELAKTTYGQALELKPGEPYPQSQIQLINDELARLAELADIEQRYNQTMESGANFEGLQNFNEALVSYQQAISIKPGDEAAQVKITEVQAKIDEINLQNQYQAAITEADQRFRAEAYQNARDLYQQALSFLPNENYPQTQIETIDRILREQEEQRQLEENYNQTIARADQAFQNEEYQDARTIYTEALSVKPEQSYPADRIRQIDDILAEQARLAQLEEDFNEAVQRAEVAFNDEEYQLSKGHYQSALELKPDASEVSARIAEIDRILQQIEDERLREEERQRVLAAERDKAYQDAMDNGNNLLAQQQFDQAREAFRLAKETKPDEFLPDEMLAKTDQLQAEYEQQLAEERAREEARLQALQAEKEKAYSFAIQQGDSLFTAENYELAKIQYETAISVMPEEEYPKRRLAETEGKIAQLARLTASYNETIEVANRFVQQNEYVQAKAKYEEALQYLPNEEYPKRQIERLNEILNRQEQERILEENYLASIQMADSLYSLNELQASKDNYQQAVELKPAESYPREQIQQIDLKLAELAREQARQEAIQTAYDEAIRKADQSLGENDYTMAKVSYNEALSLKPEETYPQEQLTRIEELIAREKENAYQQAIAKADGLFNQENYNGASLSYSDALKVKPNDEYATNQMNLIQQRLDEQAREELARQELERSYQEKMTAANTAFQNTQYQDARGLYQEALEIKPEEVVPAQQIERIDSLLVELQRQEEIDQLYAQAIKDAQNAFAQSQLPEAISFYQKAAGLKPEETLPPQRIAEIQAMIDQQAEIERLAQLEEEQRQARLLAQQEEYDAAIASADAAFNAENYREARQFYNQALGVKPDEVYPKNRILEIDGIIEGLAQAEMDRKQQAYMDSLQTAQEEAFNLKVQQGDNFFARAEYNEAITTYQEAIQIIPDRSSELNPKINDAREQIRILQEQQQNYDRAIALADQYFNNDDLQNALTSYQDALNYKPDEDYPKERIRSIQMMIETRNANYAEAIRQADELFASEDWFSSKDKYNEALRIKGNEPYPVAQIALIDQRIKADQEAQMAQQQTEESYRQTIAKGEEALVNEQYTAARTHFEFAKELMPEETYPDEKIAEINDLIAKRDREAEQERQQRLVDDRYRQAISIADNSFRQELYESAKNLYNQALDIKPEEDYPKGQIALIDQLLAEQHADINPVATAAVVPEREISQSIRHYSTNKRETEYDKNIRLADDAYNRRDYIVAKFYYRKAMEYDATKEYPVMRDAEITRLIDQSMKASELARYREAVQKADNAFTGKRYSVARFYYYQALEIKSWEQYPKERIEEIQTLTNSRLSEREEQAYRDLIVKADEAYYKKELAVARSYYQQSLGIKNDERYPKIKLLDIEKLVEQDLRDEVNREYRDIIAEGDKAMVGNNLSIARFYYNKALGVKPNEKYPKDQLEKIRQLLIKGN